MRGRLAFGNNAKHRSFQSRLRQAVAALKRQSRVDINAKHRSFQSRLRQAVAALKRRSRLGNTVTAR
jgi:hypothetical protein